MSVNHLGRGLYELLMKSEISRLFFFSNVILFIYFGLHQVLVAAYVLFVAAPRLSPWHSGSGVAARRLSCLTASGILVPLPETKPRSAVLKGRFLGLEPLWKSLDFFFSSFYVRLFVQPLPNSSRIVKVFRFCFVFVFGFSRLKQL